MRGALILAVFSALQLAAVLPAHAQTEIVLYNFCSQPNCVDGEGPVSSLTPDGAGNFYGTTQLGGANMSGIVFELSPDGGGGYNETALYSFCSLPNCTDGNDPTSNVIFDGAGNLYGTTCSGGANGQGVPSACGDGFNGYGVVFELSPEPGGGCPDGSNSGNGWCESVLYSFMSAPDGAFPFAGLTWDQYGNLYGTTYGGGSGMGTVYELSPNGSGGWSESVLYSFCAQPSCADGAYPDGQLLATNGNGDFYATTENGGAYGAGTVFGLSPQPPGGCPSGSYTGNGWCEAIVHAFAGHPTDGNLPSGTPVLDSAGNLYGTTVFGGKGNCDSKLGCGTVWKLTPSAGQFTEKVLASFHSGPLGIGCCSSIRLPDSPWAGVVLDSSGDIYGVTEYGGSSSYCTEKGRKGWLQGCGVLFELPRRPKRTDYKAMELPWIFSSADGAHPVTGLILDGGNLYGTTSNGGVGDFCPFPDGCGVAFEFTP